VPDEPHLVDLLVDQRDPAVTGLRADVDLLQRALPSSDAENSYYGGNAGSHGSGAFPGVRPRTRPPCTPSHQAYARALTEQRRHRGLAVAARRAGLGHPLVLADHDVCQITSAHPVRQSL
jgi:hypothetical protein